MKSIICKPIKLEQNRSKLLKKLIKRRNIKKMDTSIINQKSE